jgi:hypothetical protein
MLNASRLICAFLLHYSSIEEIKIGFEIMMYSKNNFDQFEGSNDILAFLCGFMKLFGGGICEIVNIMVIVQSTTILDVIKDYVAFGIIAEIDDIVASTLFGINIEE